MFFLKKKVSTYKKENEKIMNPPIELQINGLCYHYLNNNGIIKIGTYLKKNMVTVGKINEKPERKCASIAIMKENECGIVSRVINTITHDDIHIINIIVRKYRETEIGDKYCSNAAQKESCGPLLNQEDMPFHKNSLCPDLIINPLAFPSRMTLH